MKSQELNTLNHCVYKLNYHIVLTTKYRNKVITSEILEELKLLISKILNNNGASLIELNGEPDHIHILVETNPVISLTKLINTVKTITSREIRKKFKSHVSKFYWKPYFWSRSYCIISCGDVSLGILKRYLDKQETPS